VGGAGDGAPPSEPACMQKGAAYVAIDWFVCGEAVKQWQGSIMTMKRGVDAGGYSRSGRGAPCMHGCEKRRDGTGSGEE